MKHACRSFYENTIMDIEGALVLHDACDELMQWNKWSMSFTSLQNNCASKRKNFMYNEWKKWYQANVSDTTFLLIQFDSFALLK